MIVIRMSSAGYCARRLSALLLGRDGASAPSWLASSAEEGNWHEARLKEELRVLGCEVVDEQRELQIDREGFKALGHIDGRIKLSPKVKDSPLWTIHYLYCSPKDLDFTAFHLLEVKTFSFLEHQRWMAEGFDGYFKSYAGQHTLYRQALQEQLSFFTTKDRSGGARNLYVIGQDPVPANEIWEKLRQVVECAERGDLVAKEFNFESLECRRCQYRVSECLPKLPQVDDAEVIVAARDYQSGREQEKIGKLLAEQAKELLVAYAKRKQIKSWGADERIVSYSHYPRRDVSIRGLLEIMPLSSFEAAITTSEIDRITVVDSSKES